MAGLLARGPRCVCPRPTPSNRGHTHHANRVPGPLLPRNHAARLQMRSGASCPGHDAVLQPQLALCPPVTNVPATPGPWQIRSLHLPYARPFSWHRSGGGGGSGVSSCWGPGLAPAGPRCLPVRPAVRPGGGGQPRGGVGPEQSGAAALLPRLARGHVGRGGALQGRLVPAGKAADDALARACRCVLQAQARSGAPGGVPPHRAAPRSCRRTYSYSCPARMPCMQA